jgi:hypothetical protein
MFFATTSSWSGFPEVIFSETHGAVAQFAAISEFIFQTFQRFMTWPLMVRFHYGHPDVWDKAFACTNGGVSKASKMIHVAEDFFGGVNAIARGGKVLFEEFIECGKGRDMGFTSVNGFEQKISGSAGTISMSRDLFRLHRGLDFFRIFSLYFSGPGFYVSVMQTAWAVYFFALTHASLAIADLELYRVYRYFKMTETQTTLSLSKEEGGYYNSIYALQIGLLTLLPVTDENDHGSRLPRRRGVHSRNAARRIVGVQRFHHGYERVQLHEIVDLWSGYVYRYRTGLRFIERLHGCLVRFVRQIALVPRFRGSLLSPLVPREHVGEEFNFVRLVGVAVCYLSHHCPVVVLSAKFESLLDATFVVRLEKMVRRYV